MSEIFYAVNDDDEVWADQDPYECAERALGNMCPLDIEVGMTVCIFEGESTPFKLNTNIDVVERLDAYNQDLPEDTVDDIIGKLQKLNLDQYISDQIQKFVKDNSVTFTANCIVNIKPVYYKVTNIEGGVYFIYSWEECDEATHKKFWDSHVEMTDA